ncbi:MAG TPA: PIN domain-containing protein [Candidatus Kapabacteria bacterium]|nr:PIN domain-containing protein [Candidatus Kapabacteria bacterium]
MKKLRVYLDTSVIGGCFDKEFREASLALMDHIRLGIFEGLISPVSVEELSDAPEHVRNSLLEFDEDQIIRLKEAPNVLALSDAYMEAKVVPVKFKDDASHIAYATVYGADVVVSWNFRHIVNFQRIHASNAVNIREGYPLMDIRTPKELIYGREEEF